MNDPKINVLAVVLAPGAAQKITDGFGGSAVSFFFSPLLTLGNTLEVTFGPTGNPVVLAGFNGAFVRLGGPVSEVLIRNTGAGTASGQIVASPCTEFLIVGM